MKPKTKRKYIANFLLGFHIAIGILIWHHQTYVLRTEHVKTITVVKAAEVQRQFTIEERIRAIARNELFGDADFLVELGRKESGLNPSRIQSGRNNPLWSADRGLYQFNNYYQKGVSDDCAMNIDCSTKIAIAMIRSGHSNLWVAARSMRKPKL